MAAVVAIFPHFCSPYSPSRQFRDLPYAAPGRYHGASVQWLVPGEPYRWLGVVPASLRLFGSPEPGRVLLLGSDEFGRDWYSRLCHGASVSLLLAPAAAVLSLVLAVALGGWAGYHGGWIDRLLMRATEVFVVLPWFYVVVALRAALPLTLSSAATLFAVFALLSVLGCATPTRLFRGLVLSTKSAEFVLAARAAGAGGPRIFRSHLAPVPAARGGDAVSGERARLHHHGSHAVVPRHRRGGADRYWGGMLVPLQQYIVLTVYPWMFAPAVAIVVVCFAFQVVAQTATATPVPVAAKTPSFSS